jgi:two-component system, NtrC family, sensor kinase
MQFFSRLSIRTKINLGIALVILILGLVSTVLVVRITSGALMEEIKKRGSSLTLNLAARTTEPLLAQDFLRLKDVVDEIKASSDDIFYAFVLDKNGQVMSHTFKTGFPVALVQANILLADSPQHIELLDVGDDLVYDFAVPIQVGPNRLGITRLGLSRAKAQSTIDSLMQTVINVSLGTGLAAILLGTLFAGTVISRLNTLRQSAEDIVRGNLDLSTISPPEKHCWEIHDCRQQDCPAYGDSLHRCWHLPGTCYHQGEGLRAGSKSEDCQFCKVYLENRGDEIQTLAEAFDVMAYSLKNYIGYLRRAEQNIRRQQQLLQTILDGTPDLVSLQDENLNYQAVNQAFRSFFGIPEQEILGKGPDFRFGQELLGQNLEEDWQVLSQGKFISQEIEVNQDQGIRRWFHVVKLPIYDGNRIAGLLCTARDISELKNYQEKMIQSLKLEELGKLAGGLADELKTPLGIILGYTKILMEDLTQEPELLEHLRVIDKQAQVGYQIVSDLLNFSRKGAGVREKLDLNKSLQEVVQLVRHTFQQEGISIRVDLDPNIPAIMGDEAKLKQVWMHLLNNAFAAIPKAGIIAVVSKFAQDKGSVLISVADNGPGINSQARAKIFEPFFNTKSTSLGIGLGLSFSYAVIKDHQGKISVFSPIQPELAQEMAGPGNSNGPGTQFFIEMPLAHQEALDAGSQEVAELPVLSMLPM